MISLPHEGKQSENVVRFLGNILHKVLPQDVELKFVDTETKFSAEFQIKDETKDEHKHDLAYHTKCPECDESYTGETRKRLQDWVDEHSGKNSKFDILRHSQQDKHKNVSTNNFSNSWKLIQKDEI